MFVNKNVNLIAVFAAVSFFGLIALVVFGLYMGATDKRISAWYPVYEMSAVCPDKTYNVILMDRTTGWTNVPFVIDIDSKKEISLSSLCTTTTTNEFPIWSGDPLNDTRVDFQKQYTLYTGVNDRLIDFSISK